MTVGGPHSYAIAKLALNRLTQDLGENYTDEGLTAIALHPGGVLTPGAIAGMEEVPHMKDCKFGVVSALDFQVC